MNIKNFQINSDERPYILNCEFSSLGDEGLEASLKVLEREVTHWKEIGGHKKLPVNKIKAVMYLRDSDDYLEI